MQFAYLAIAALTAAVLTSPSQAQAPAEATDTPVAGFAGYAHPDIGPDDCKVISPGETQCVIPPKTAGRYIVEAAGTSTAKGEGASQVLSIRGKGYQCAQVSNTAKWSSGPRTFRMVCVINVLTDEPLTIRAIYADKNATKDPKGPVLRFQRVSWNGILDSTYLGAK